MIVKTQKIEYLHFGSDSSTETVSSLIKKQGGISIYGGAEWILRYARQIDGLRTAITNGNRGEPGMLGVLHIPYDRISTILHYPSPYDSGSMQIVMNCGAKVDTIASFAVAAPNLFGPDPVLPWRHKEH